MAFQDGVMSRVTGENGSAPLGGGRSVTITVLQDMCLVHMSGEARKQAAEQSGKFGV